MITKWITSFLSYTLIEYLFIFLIKININDEIELKKLIYEFCISYIAYRN